MSAQWDPRDKTFVITGGASGLGALYTEWFLKEGAKSIAVLDIAVEKGQELEAKLNKSYPGKVSFYNCDVSDEAQLTDVFNQVVKNEHAEVKNGRYRPWIKVNNLDEVCIVTISVVRPDIKTLVEISFGTGTMEVSIISPQGLISLTLKGVKHMRKDEGGAGGTIINVSSTLAIMKKPHLPIYSGSKIAVLHFTESLAMDPIHENTGIRFLTFCLDATQTDLLNDLQNKSWDTTTGKIFANYVVTVQTQKPESAANAVMKMFKKGANGSIWLSAFDKPAEDITQIIHSAFKSFEQILR